MVHRGSGAAPHATAPWPIWAPYVTNGPRRPRISLEMGVRWTVGDSSVTPLVAGQQSPPHLRFRLRRLPRPHRRDGRASSSLAGTLTIGLGWVHSAHVHAYMRIDAHVSV